VFGIGLNYGAHAAESGFARPETAPPVFTKSRRASPVRTRLSGDWFGDLASMAGRAAVRVPAVSRWRLSVTGISAW
jgi:2,4-diketo-3-deoxy-L-fuconate hydrolase